MTERIVVTKFMRIFYEFINSALIGRIRICLESIFHEFIFIFLVEYSCHDQIHENISQVIYLFLSDRIRIGRDQIHEKIPRTIPRGK